MSGGFKLKPLHPVATVLDHLRLIVVVTGLVTLILGIMVLMRVRPEYRAEAGIEVELMHSRVLVWDQEKQFGSRTQYTDYLNTQLKYITSYENVTEALSRLENNPAFQPTGNPRVDHFRFIRMLEVRAVRNTHLMVVAVKNDQPDGLADLVNTIVDTYMDRVREHELGKNDNRILHLRKELVREQDELTRDQERMTELSLELKILNLSRENNPHDESLGFLRSAYNQASIRRIKAENAYQGMMERIRREKDLSLDPLVEELIMEDLSAIDMRNRVFENRQELFRQSAFMTEEHPNRKRLEQEVNLTQEYLEQIQTDLREKGEEIVKGKRLLQHERDLIEYRGVYDEAVKDEDDVRARYEAELINLKQMTPLFLKARQVNSQVENSKARIAQIESRIEELIIETREPGRIRVQTRARDPLYPNKDRRKLYLMMAGVFGLAMALLAAFALDLLEPSVIDARHMTQIIGTRPTGVLFERKNCDYAQLLHQNPDSFHADQFRRIMPRIFENVESPHIVTIVSPANGHGASSFALNCAAHLQRSGQDTALLEVAASRADLPERLKSWNMQTRNRSINAGRNTMELTRYSADNLDCYNFKSNEFRHELSDKEALGPLLKELSEGKRILLVDAPPLFQNSEAEQLCRLADTCILVVNGPKTAPGALTRAVSLLEELGVKRCAVIGNRLPPLPGGFFTRAAAAYEGRELKYPLLVDVLAAMRRALDPRNRKW